MRMREVFGILPAHPVSQLVLCCLFLGLSVPIMAQLAEVQKKRERAEIFHVSRVGQGGAAESREVLLALYEKAAGSYNEKIRREEAANSQLFKGERVRVIKRLHEEDENGPLFLVAYDGGPSVIAVKGDANMSPGDLSAPLTIAAAGQHTMEVTRRIRVKNPKEREPALEVVEKKTSGVPTFFGIPIDTGSGLSSSSNSNNNSGSGSSSTSSSGGGSTYKTVTDTQTLKKFVGTVSTERLVEGPPKMSTELFMKQLKNGEVFEVARDEKRRCQECRGFGRVKTTRPVGFRDPDGKMPCPNCGGGGKVDWDVTYKIVW